jgi:hypothetical protein
MNLQTSLNLSFPAPPPAGSWLSGSATAGPGGKKEGQGTLPAGVFVKERRDPGAQGVPAWKLEGAFAARVPGEGQDILFFDPHEPSQGELLAPPGFPQIRASPFTSRVTSSVRNRAKLFGLGMDPEGQILFKGG